MLKYSFWCILLIDFESPLINHNYSKDETELCMPKLRMSKM